MIALRYNTVVLLLSLVAVLLLVLSVSSAWVIIAVALTLPFFWWIAEHIPDPLVFSWPGFLLWLQGRPRVWAVRSQLAFYARVPILCAAALVMFAPLSWRSAAGLLGNLFILEKTYQFGIVAFMSTVASFMVLLTFRVTELNAQERFPDFNAALIRRYGTVIPPPPRKWSGKRLWLVFVFALIIPLSCLCHTYLLQPLIDWPQVHSAIFYIVVGLFAALATGLAAVLAETFLPWWHKDPNPEAPDVLPFESLPYFPDLRRIFLARSAPDSSFARIILFCLGPGYATVTTGPDRAWIRTGHRHNLICGAVALAAYVGSYIWWRCKGSIPPGFWPPVSFVLLLLLLLCFILHTLTFWLDRYRFPTLLFAGLTSFAAFMLFHTDHYYELDPIAAPLDVWEHIAAYDWEISGWIALICWALLLPLLIGHGFGKTLYRIPPWRFSVARTESHPWWCGAIFALPWAAWLTCYVLNSELESPPPLDIVPPLKLETVFEEPGWNFGGKTVSGKTGKTLVVVTAEGGGIQASAWATKVLTGLHQRYGKDFSRSIGLISGVSGGGVGAMYYLANWKANCDDPLSGAACDNINKMSQTSCMEASAWGMTFPDFLRFGMPLLIPRDVDRGWALEESWTRNLRNSDDVTVKKKADDWRLRHLWESAAEGRAPVPVFNATLVETGQRLLISPVCKNPAPVRKSPAPTKADKSKGATDKSLALTEKTSPVEFLRLFDDESNNMRVSTAARLSAGFAYVSPVSCARRTLGKDLTDPLEILKNSHVVDGGYVDNEGVFTVVDWVNFLIDHYRNTPSGERPFDHVVILRIRSFPPWYSASSPGVNGWTDEFWGPITALQSVRSASQAERNSEILKLLKKADYPAPMRMGDVFEAMGKKPGQWLGVHSTEEAGRLVNKWLEVMELMQNYDLTVETIEFPFSPMIDGTTPQPEKTYVTPLSWSLTSQQKVHIDNAWKALCQQKIAKDKDGKYPLEELDAYFERKP